PCSLRVRIPGDNVSTRTSQPSAISSRRSVATEATTPLTAGSRQSVVSSTRRGRRGAAPGRGLLALSGGGGRSDRLHTPSLAPAGSRGIHHTEERGQTPV